MPVYIIRAGDTDRVKIGWTGRNPAIRLRALQQTCREELRIIRLIDTGRAGERWLHRQFAAHRLSGEWFTFVPEMMQIKIGTVGTAPCTFINEIEQMADAAGLSFAALCRRAGLDASAFYRWKSGKTSPNLRSLQKMLDAIEAARASRSCEAA